jgi:hypothetical protein
LLPMLKTTSRRAAPSASSAIACRTGDHLGFLGADRPGRAVAEPAADGLDTSAILPGAPATTRDSPLRKAAAGGAPPAASADAQHDCLGFLGHIDPLQTMCAELAVRAALRYGPPAWKLLPTPMIRTRARRAARHRIRATVLPEWIDWNGHMNVGFYVVAFDKATDTLGQPVRLQLGSTPATDRHDLRGRGARHLRPRGQEGDPLRITTQILDHDAKRLHYIHAMYHATRLSRRHQRADADEHRL